jgi:hypothetical protein
LRRSARPISVAGLAENDHIEADQQQVAPVAAPPAAIALPAPAPFLGGGAFLGGLGLEGASVGPVLGHGSMLSLQRTAGNQSVSGLVLRGLIRPASVARQPAAPPAPPAPGPASTPAGPSSAPAGPTTAPGTTPASPTIGDCPSPADAVSNIDWEGFWKDEKLNIIRTALEVARLWPGFGLLAGGAADFINASQDFDAIKGEDADTIKDAMVVRHAIAITNNALGHAIYVTQLIQDIATASVVGAEVDAVTIPLNEAMLTVKVGLDGAQFMLDFGLLCGAKYRSMKAPPGPAGDASKAAWDGMVANYEANLLGDLVGGIFDIIDLSSAGFANAGPVKQGGKAVKEAFSVAKFVKGLIKSVLQGWFGVWGGKAFERNKCYGVLGRQVEQQAAQFILTELTVMKASYQLGDLIIGAAADHIAKQIAELNQIATIATGGKDPFILARDAAVEGLGHMEQRIADLADMQVLSSSAKEKAEAVRGFCDEALAKIALVVVPTITLPKPQTGLGETADELAAMAAEAANALVEGMISELREGVESLKREVSDPVRDIKGHADELGEFFQVVTDEALVQIGVASRKVADFKGKLAQCHKLEDVVNLIVRQVFDMVGMQSDFEIDDIRKLWVDVGGMIDEGIVWAQALHDGERVPEPRNVTDEEDDVPTPGADRAARAGEQGAGAAGGAAGGGAAGGRAAAGGGRAPAGAAGGAAGGGGSVPSHRGAGAGGGYVTPAVSQNGGGAGAGAGAQSPAPAPPTGTSGGPTGGGAPGGGAPGGTGAMQPYKPGQEPAKTPAGGELGALIGGAAGSALGAALGTMTGGIAGGMTGSALGGALGGGIGSMIGEGLNAMGSMGDATMGGLVGTGLGAMGGSFYGTDPGGTASPAYGGMGGVGGLGSGMLGGMPGGMMGGMGGLGGMMGGMGGMMGGLPGGMMGGLGGMMGGLGGMMGGLPGGMMGGLGGMMGGLGGMMGGLPGGMGGMGGLGGMMGAMPGGMMGGLGGMMGGLGGMMGGMPGGMMGGLGGMMGGLPGGMTGGMLGSGLGGMIGGATGGAIGSGPATTGGSPYATLSAGALAAFGMGPSAAPPASSFADAVSQRRP